MKQSEINKKTRIFRQKRQGVGYQENNALGYQCIAGAKLFMKEVYGMNVGKVGNAIELRANTYKTFDPELWIRREYDGSRKPQTGDFVFFKSDASNGYLGHIGICDIRIPMGISILEQNGGGKGNTAPGDEFTIRNRKLTNCLGRWSRIMIEPPL